MNLADIICQGCIIFMVAARVFHINLLLICVTLQCVVNFQPCHLPMSTAACHLMLVGQCKWYPNYSIKKVITLLDFSCMDGTVCYTVSATWECLKHPACVTKFLLVLPCLKLSLIWHTKEKEKSNWSVKTYIKADHNTSRPFGIKVMSKYNVLSKRERGVIKWCIESLCVVV